MVQKQTQQTIKVPIKLCNRTFAGLEEVNPEFTLIQAEPSANYFAYKKGMGLSSYPITIHIKLEKLDNR